MPHIKKIFNEISCTQMDKDNWVVMAKKISDGSTTNLGNFKTYNEAKALVDFIKAGMQSDMTPAQILNTYTAIENARSKS